MKALFILGVVACLVGCSRSDRWSVAAVNDLSDKEYRRVRVDVVTKGEIPWPLKLSVSVVDASQKRIESSLPRWTARQVGPNSVVFAFEERLSEKTKPVVLDLKIAAAGHSSLRVHHVLARK